MSLSKMKVSRRYTEDDVLQAVAAVQNGTMKYREASAKYNIPLSSLCDRIKQRVPLTPSHGGEIFVIRSVGFKLHLHYSCFNIG